MQNRAVISFCHFSKSNTHLSITACFWLFSFFGNNEITIQQKWYNEPLIDVMDALDKSVSQITKCYDYFIFFMLISAKDEK